MNTKEIVVGRVYGDGDRGLREVVSIYRDSYSYYMRVRYRILAARFERACNGNGQWESLVGTESRCTLETFAKWSKASFTPEEAHRALLMIKASRLRLPASDKRLMTVLAQESAGRCTAGTSFEIAVLEKAAARRLVEKGLLRDFDDQEATVTELGSAFIRTVDAASSHANT